MIKSELVALLKNFPDDAVVVLRNKNYESFPDDLFLEATSLTKIKNLCDVELRKIPESFQTPAILIDSEKN